MAATYAALVSLTHTIDQILNPPPHHHFNFDRDQINCLRQKVDFLIDFLEKNQSSTGGDHKEIEDLETRIRVVAEGAEYIIEDNVMNHILAGSEVDRSVETSTLSEGVQTSIQDFDSIEEELVRIEKDHVQHKNSITTEASLSSSSSRPLLPIGKNIMVGFDGHVNEIMGALSTDESNRQIIPIVGMGGIGKTTLATHVYTNPFIVQHFHVRAWFTVSQEYTKKEILLGLLHKINNKNSNDAHDMNDEDELGDKLHKTLFGRKYLIVMDDMWDINAWEMINMFLPDNNNGSRILVTTRLLRLAMDIGSCRPYQLNFLDEEQSWDLLSQKIYADKCCPVELEVIGRSIAKKCRGLPLALVVIGGVLAKSKTENWKYIEEDVTSAVRNQDDEFYMKILLLSYNNMPIYLKPCFLYFAVFPEDYTIKVSKLVSLWVAEGFIRQCGHKSLEENGNEYLEDLIDRNLVLVDWRSISGEVRSCRIHDLLSNLCRTEAQKDNFILTRKLYNPNTLSYLKITQRLNINGGKWKGMKLTPDTSPVPIRSLLCFSPEDSNDYTVDQVGLLRVLNGVDRYPIHEILQLINLRYVSCMGPMTAMSSSISRLWSLQTLIVDGELNLPSEIWQMPQLRHVEATRIHLADPPPDDVKNIILLQNLQTLSTVIDLKCTEAVIKRILNIKKFGIICPTFGSIFLRNLGHLHKLEELYLQCTPCGGDVVFPNSLKRLILRGCKIPWEDMSVVGSLPNLEALTLWTNAVVGQKWISKEGEFTRLKFLYIYECELEIWEADNTHFPCLEILSLGYLNLKEIPSEFAEILSLQAINFDCNSNNDLLLSANEISEQRENLGYNALHVQNFTCGVFRIWVKRGINLVVVNDGHIGDPYVVITSSKQSVKTRVVTKDINPEWDEKLGIRVANRSHSISLTVHDRTKFKFDDKLGEANLDIRPFFEAVKLNPNGLPNGSISARVLPSISNCLTEESSVFWENGTHDDLTLCTLKLYAIDILHP
ncbi:PREDICTED: putative late blight resistance protein homolog R1A-3 [Erythranthe guttata]|nr:PREDICTED: putative late blight resistance protein homolog R1A-3 [Erythranthe guttata]|eukprot:XP_012853212.1 PREDICTED: putative late blight resistance protein homolog R1A-3 [Erythranthe guttata]